MTRRVGPARVAAVNAKRPRTPPVVVAGGPAPMTTAIAEIIRAMVDRQRQRERG